MTSFTDSLLAARKTKRVHGQFAANCASQLDRNFILRQGVDELALIWSDSNCSHVDVDSFALTGSGGVEERWEDCQFMAAMNIKYELEIGKRMWVGGVWFALIIQRWAFL